MFPTAKALFLAYYNNYSPDISVRPFYDLTYSLPSIMSGAMGGYRPLDYYFN